MKIFKDLFENITVLEDVAMSLFFVERESASGACICVLERVEIRPYALSRIES